MHDLKRVFSDLCKRAGSNAHTGDLWNEIERHYSGSKRYYHNLQHLSNMLTHLELCREFIREWDCVLFALFYHDYIYKATAKDNEEQSAGIARVRITALGLPQSKISIVSDMILATKGHDASQNSDVNYFTDADLSILGAPAGEYDQYTRDVRKEYSIYPDILYKPGRKKVLKHFLDMPYLFKTDFFRERLEDNARRNILRELTALT